ncbi:MAG: PEGA domain-containing protein [Bryobacteraceae bacterium]
MKKLLLIGVAFAALLPMTASARGRVGVFIGPAFSPYGWYGPYGYAFGPYPYAPYFGAPNAGQVKLDTHSKDAGVFINGNFAGRAGDLKTMTLRPGDYTVEVREPGKEPFVENIHVLAGKTLKLHPDVPLS